MANGTGGHHDTRGAWQLNYSILLITSDWWQLRDPVQSDCAGPILCATATPSGLVGACCVSCCIACDLFVRRRQLMHGSWILDVAHSPDWVHRSKVL